MYIVLRGISTCFTKSELLYEIKLNSFISYMPFLLVNGYHNKNVYNFLYILSNCYKYNIVLLSIVYKQICDMVCNQCDLKIMFVKFV